MLAALCCGLAALCYAEFATHGPGLRVGVHVLLRHHRRAGRLDHRLGPAPGDDARRVGGRAGLGVLLRDVARPARRHLARGLGYGDTFNLPAFLLVACLTLLVAYGIKESMRVNLVLVALKVFIVLFVIVAGIGFINTDNYQPFVPPAEPVNADQGWLHTPLLQLVTGAPQAYGVMGVIFAASLVFFAYIGFDVVATTAEEASNPQRDLPRGIIGSLVICTALYVAVALVITGMVKYDEIDPAAALASAFVDVGKDGYATIISAGAVAGLTTVVMTLIIGAIRVTFAMCRDNLLPRSFAHVTPSTGTPVRITLAVGVTVALVASLTPIGKLEEMVNIGTLTAFALVSIAVPILRTKRPDLQRSFRCRSHRCCRGCPPRSASS